MKIFLVRYFCGFFGFLLVGLYFVIGLRIQLSMVSTLVGLLTIFIFPGVIHVIRLRNIPMVRFEFLTCGIESILVAVIAIVGLSLLMLIGNLYVFISGTVIALIALLMYPSHVLRWDYDHLP